MNEHTVNKYIDLFKLKKIPDNTIYEVIETGKHYIKRGHNWEEMTKAKLNGDTGLTMSLYDLNQSSMLQFPPKTAEELDNIKPLLEDWHKQFLDRHFMLLSHKLHYYTIFENGISSMTFGQSVINILKEFNKIYSIEEDKENQGWEIWACLQDTDTAPEIFYLFPYEAGVVYYG